MGDEIQLNLLILIVLKAGIILVEANAKNYCSDCFIFIKPKNLKIIINTIIVMVIISREKSRYNIHHCQKKPLVFLRFN